jgi:hypothetical protein
MSPAVTPEDSDRRRAIDKLPLPYSEALRLRAAGIADELVAEILDVDPAALPGVYALAEDKIAGILEHHASNDHLP